MFKKIWGHIKDNIGGIVGGAIGGPLGAAIGMIMQELLRGLEFQYARNVEKEVEEWADDYFITYVSESVKWVTHTDAIHEKGFLAKYNEILLNLRSWQAYNESIANREGVGVFDKQVAQAKVTLLFDAVKLFKQAYEDAAMNLGLKDLKFVQQVYDPSAITEVAGEKLNWKGIGVNTIKANNTFLSKGNQIFQTATIQSQFAKSQKDLPNSQFVTEKDMDALMPNTTVDTPKQPTVTESVEEETDRASTLPTPSTTATAESQTKTSTQKNKKGWLIAALIGIGLHKMFKK